MTKKLFQTTSLACLTLLISLAGIKKATAMEGDEDISTTEIKQTRVMFRDESAAMDKIRSNLSNDQELDWKQLIALEKQSKDYLSRGYGKNTRHHHNNREAERQRVAAQQAEIERQRVAAEQAAAATEVERQRVAAQQAEAERQRLAAEQAAAEAEWKKELEQKWKEDFERKNPTRPPVWIDEEATRRADEAIRKADEAIRRADEAKQIAYKAKVKAKAAQKMAEFALEQLSRERGSQPSAAPSISLSNIGNPNIKVTDDNPNIHIEADKTSIRTATQQQADELVEKTGKARRKAKETQKAAEMAQKIAEQEANNAAIILNEIAEAKADILRTITTEQPERREVELAQKAAQRAANEAAQKLQKTVEEGNTYLKKIAKMIEVDHEEMARYPELEARLQRFEDALRDLEKNHSAPTPTQEEQSSVLPPPQRIIDQVRLARDALDEQRQRSERQQ